MAGDEGFEPPQTESESGVLPLHKSPLWLGSFRLLAEQRVLLYTEPAKCQEVFLKIWKVFLKEENLIFCPAAVIVSPGKGENMQ